MIGAPVSNRLQRALFIALTILTWLALAVIVGWLLSHVTHALLVLVLAGLLSFALTPLVKFFNRWLPLFPSILLAYLIGIVVFFGLLALIGVTAAAEIRSAVHQFPQIASSLQRLQPWLVSVLSPLGVTQSQLAAAEARLLTALEAFGTNAASDAIGLVSAVINTVVDAVLVFILSIYLVASGPKLVKWIRSQVPPGQTDRTNVLIRIFNQVVGGYVRGTLTMATLIGLMVGVGMQVLGVRYALLLGILAFFMEFVPVLGVLISGTVCVLVALLNGWITAVLVLAYFVVVHVLEGDVIGPRVMGKAVGIHPAVALLALVAGTELFGLWGALFGAPIAGLMQAFAVTIWSEIRQGPVREQAAAAPEGSAADTPPPELPPLTAGEEEPQIPK